MSTTLYDVFIAYNSKDYDWASNLAKQLQGAGLDVFFDRSEIKLGAVWIVKLADALRRSRAFTILIGRHGVGPWQEAMELRTAITAHVSKGCPLVPILLPGANAKALPDFLNLNQCLDLNKAPLDLLELISAVTGADAAVSRSQIGERFTVNLKWPKSHARDVTLFTLPKRGTSGLLNITWTTFGEGIECLGEQIKNYGHRPPIKACIGINDAGLAMAAFLNSSVLERKPLGYIRCEALTEGVKIGRDSLLPDLPPDPTILLVDFEVKSGKAQKSIIEELREKYGAPTTYLAVFGALTDSEDLKIGSLDQLTSAKVLLEVGVKDIFAAATMHRPGIEPPLELR